MQMTSYGLLRTDNKHVSISATANVDSILVKNLNIRQVLSYQLTQLWIDLRIFFTIKDNSLIT